MLFSALVSSLVYLFSFYLRNVLSPCIVSERKAFSLKRESVIYYPDILGIFVFINILVCFVVVVVVVYLGKYGSTILSRDRERA